MIVAHPANGVGRGCVADEREGGKVREGGDGGVGVVALEALLGAVGALEAAVLWVGGECEGRRGRGRGVVTYEAARAMQAPVCVHCVWKGAVMDGRGRGGRVAREGRRLGRGAGYIARLGRHRKISQIFATPIANTRPTPRLELGLSRRSAPYHRVPSPAPVPPSYAQSWSAGPSSVPRPAPTSIHPA